jgi:hypothetical protein
MTDVTVTTEAPLPAPGNSPEARTTDGTLIDQSKVTTTPTETPTPEPKPTTEPKPEDKTPAGAPAKYADFKVPEGFKFDDKVLPEVQATFKELNLTQEAGQKLIDFYTKNFQEAAQAPYKAWADTQKTWNEEITTRFGDRADGIRANINKAIDTVLPPSLARSYRAALDLTGAGSNPDIVEALSIFLKPHFEGTPVPGGRLSPEANKAPGAGPVSIADAMYPHLRK